MTAITARGSGARWLYAVKPGSWPKLLVPLLLGQALGVHAGAFAFAAFLLGALFTLSGLCFIVLLNDWADREVDTLKRRMFPQGCSPKTLPDGILHARPLLLAALLSGAVALSAAAAGAALLDRPWLAAMGVFDMLVFLAYSMPPARLNYRGGGELLEMAGVGLLLPWWNAYAQSGLLWTPVYAVLPGFSLLALASAVASGLSDEVSDRAGGKTTVVTRFGNAAARRLVDGCLVLGAVALLAGAALAMPAWLSPAPAVVVLAHLPRLRDRGRDALTNAFAAQTRYKAQLHRAVARAALALAACVVYAGAVV